MGSTLAPGCIGIALALSACQSSMPVAEPAKAIATENASVQALDPQSLIGVWSGRISPMDKASLYSKMVLTIRRVTGSWVFGRAEIYPYRSPPFSWPFRGSLEGNELRIRAWRLTVFPKRMTGHTYGGTGGLAGHGGADVDLIKESDTIPDSSREEPIRTPCRFGCPGSSQAP